MASLTKIEGIGKVQAKKMAAAGVRTTQTLLKMGSSSKGRRQLAELTGISPKVILRSVNCADLFRVKGVGEEYADLLEAAGVDTVPELGQRNAHNLHEKMVEVNKRKKLVRKLPTAGQVGYWVKQAKDLPRAIHY